MQTTIFRASLLRAILARPPQRSLLKVLNRAKMSTVLTREQLILPETQALEGKFGSLKLTGTSVPLALGTTLDGYERRDLTPAIGTEFARGVQLAELLKVSNSDAILRDLAILIARRGVVFFRGQDDLTPADMRELGERLGRQAGKPTSSTLHVHPTTDAGAELGDEVTVLDSTQAGVYDSAVSDKSRFAAMDWHSDISFEAVPADYTMLKLHTLPARGGGDTMWASGYAAYERLSPSFAKYLETLEAVHEARFFIGVAKRSGISLRDGERGSPANVGRHLEAVHPVIRTNPVTGWKSLYVNQAFTKRIVGLTRDESDVLLKHLFMLVAMNHDLQVRFFWEKNSLAIWDNRSTYHAATQDYGGQLRVGDRVVSVGEKPYFDPRSKSRAEALGHGH